MNTLATEAFDAIILGAGPAGTASAIRLAQAGWSVALVEKSQFPRRKVCGEFLAAATLPLLDALGVAASFLEIAGPPVREVAIFAADRVLRAPMPAAAADLPWGRALCRERLDTLLRDRAVAVGATLWQPWRAGPMERHGSIFGCRIESRGSGENRVLQAPIVIDAGGSWEPRASEAGQERGGAGSVDLLAFKRHFTHTALPDGLMPLLAFPGGYGGLVHSDAGHVSLSCCIRRDRLLDCRLRFPRCRAGDAVLAHILYHCRGARDALTAAAPAHGWLGAGPLRPGIRDVYQDGVFKVGNAAGEAHPVVAEGISMAIQGAWLLSCLLLRHRQVPSGTALASVGAAYRHAWRAAFATRIRFAALCAQLAMRPAMAAGILRLLQAYPTLLTRCARISGKTARVQGIREVH